MTHGSRVAAERAAGEFGAKLRGVLDQLGWSAEELGRMTGTDGSTIIRITDGHNTTMATLCRIVAAVGEHAPALAAELTAGVRNLARATPPVSDYNGDGKADEDDLVPCIAAMDTDVASLLDQSIRLVAGGGVSLAAKLAMVEQLGRLSAHIAACEALVAAMHDQWVRGRSRGGA